MSINSISSSVNYTGISRCQRITKQDNVITLKTETPIDLGTIDGKPFIMQIFQDGGFEWSGSQRIKVSPTDTRVTPEQAAAAYASHSYTMTEHLQGDRVSAVINYLYSMANKDEDPSAFNTYIKSSRISQGEVEDALYRLGVNIDKEFTLNERTFVLENGTLKNYKEAK